MPLLVVAAIATALFLLRARRRGWQEGWSALGAVAAGYVLLSIGFFWQFWLLPDVQVPRGGGDLLSFLYPTYRFAADALQGGQFPFWNPRLFGGAPFAADLQSGLYYPPNLVAFWLARPFTYETLETLAALHYPLAGFSTYVLARELGLPRLGAFASGLAYMLSGFAVAHLGHYNMLAAAAWAPFVLTVLLRALRLNRLDWALVGGGAFALVLLPGHTQTALYLVLALVLVWLAALRRRDAVTFLVLPIMLVVGAAAAAVLLLPAFELTRLSIRSDITYAQAAEFSASPFGLITFVAPQFFGDGPNDYWGLRWSLQESYGYVGVSGLTLAALALLAPRRRRLALPLAAFAGFWLLVALGETTPLHGWLYRLVPGFDKVRAPGRGMLFVDLALALLIGLGVAELASSPSWRNRPPARRLVRALVVAVGAMAFVAVPLFYYAALTSQDKDPVILRRAVTAAASVDLSLGFLIGATLLLWRWLRRPRAWLAPAAVGLLALDLAVASAGFNPTTEDLLAGYRHDVLITWLRQHVGDARVDTRTGIADALQPDLALLVGLDDVSGLFNPLELRAFDRYWEGLGSRLAPGYDLLAVRYVIARRDAPLDTAKFRRVYETDPKLAVFENTGALPRAFVAARAERLTEADAAARLRDPAFDPRALAFIDADPVGGSGGGDVVALERPTTNDLVARLRDVRGGYLVVSEVLYPGWRAAVDGVDAPVVRAYNLFQGVPLPPGAREVHLTFRPTRWSIALAVTGLGWLAVVVGAALVVGRRVRPVLNVERSLAWS